jgi:hypothetical protein
MLHTKADAALMMQLGCDGGRQYFVPCHANVIDALIFVLSVCRVWHIHGTFSEAEDFSQPTDDFGFSQSGEPAKRARAIVQAVNQSSSPRFVLDAKIPSRLHITIIRKYLRR